MKSRFRVTDKTSQPIPGLAEFAESLFEYCKRGERILICAHQRPDGDSIGSQLALSRLLSREGACCRIVNCNPVPKAFRIVPWWPNIEVSEDCPYQWGMLFCADTSSLDWLGFGNVPELGDRVQFNLDHHQTNIGYGRFNMVDSTCSSTCELVYHLYHALGCEIDPETARCLFLGMMTDTGNFSFRKAGPVTFRAAADLMERGVDHWQMNKSIYMGRPLDWLRLMGRILSRVEAVAGGTILIARITPEVLEEMGTGREHTHGIINQMTEIKGVEVAITFNSCGEGIHVELRATGDADVSRVAKTLGGGGHKSAAGCTVNDSPEHVETVVLDMVRKLLRGRELDQE